MTELPSGTVTFLFTDIEGSTRLLTGLRDRYGKVLAEHQRVLRAAFDEHDAAVRAGSRLRFENAIAYALGKPARSRAGQPL